MCVDEVLMCIMDAAAAWVFCVGPHQTLRLPYHPLSILARESVDQMLQGVLLPFKQVG